MDCFVDRISGTNTWMELKAITVCEQQQKQLTSETGKSGVCS